MTTPLYGLLAAFDSPEAVLAAARQVRADGYRQVEAFTPFRYGDFLWGHMASFVEFKGVERFS